MQNQLFQLILLGQFSFLVCEVHQYIFIDLKKSWCEARAYCKARHTDLASVPNGKFMVKLEKTLKSQKAWIGLRRSQPGADSASLWPENELNSTENCPRTDEDGWKAVPCHDRHQFVCYSETNQDKEQFHVIKEKKSWHEAQEYCRKHHSDLASGSIQLDEAEKQSKLPSMSWIGFFKDTWRWIDNSSFSSRDWKTFCDEKCEGNCAVSLPKNSGKWETKTCGARKPFICYQDNVMLIKQEEDWDAAFKYCRENHGDLVSIVTLDDQSWIQEKAREANTEYIWLGLQYSCPLDLWFWLNDMVSDESLFQEPKHCDTVVAMSKKGEYTLFSKSENRKFNFVCSGKVEP